MTACPHGMPSPASCLTCMEDDGLGPPPAPPPPTVSSRSFTARHPGHCRGCAFPIEPGEQVVYMDDQTLRHATPECGGAS